MTGSTNSGGKQPVLLMNPRSGGGTVERYRLADEARARGIEPVVLEAGDDPAAVAREAASSASAIGMAGGDGSQAAAASVAAEAGLPFVCVPAGTRNHLALDLGLNPADVVGSLDAFTEGVERRIDLGFVNERAFVNNVSLGVYAQIVRSDAYRDAKLETVTKMLPDLVGPDSEPFDLRYRDAEGNERRSARLVLVSNNPYVLDRLGAVGSRPRLDTGALGILAVDVADAGEAATLVSLQAVGQAQRFSGWEEWSAARFEVSSGGPVAAGIDGEAATIEPPLRFRIAPGALRVLLPPSAGGLLSATLHRGLHRSILRDLWRIAAARR